MRIAIELLMMAMSMAAIYATYLLMMAVFCGVGLVVRRAFGLKHTPDMEFLPAFWMGLAITIWFLILWNFVFPVNAVAFYIVVFLGALGLYLARHDVVRLFHWPSKPLILAVLLVGGLWIANRSMSSMTAWDSGLYHLQGIKWARAYPAVPGLANLYGPLGFNNSSFLYGAFVQAGPWGPFAHHVANSTLLYAALVQCVIALFWVGKRGSSESRYVFDYLFLAPVITFIAPNLSGFSTDLPMTLTLMAAVSGIFVFLTTSDNDPNERAYRIVSVITLLALAVCFKFSSVIFVGVASLVIGALWFRKSQVDSRLKWKSVGWATAIALGMGVAWLARGILLSGYPVFPNTIGALPVEWRAPAEHAQAEFDFIVHSGRASAYSLGEVPGIERFSVWFPRWLPRIVFESPFDIFVPGCLAIIGAIVYLLLKRRQSSPDDSARSWLLLIPAFPAIIAWFAVAPELRYAKYLFWTVTAVCVTQAIRLIASRCQPHQLRRGIVILGLLVGLAPSVVDPMLWRARRHRSVIYRVFAWNLTPRAIGNQTRLEVPPVQTFVTKSGLQLNVPMSAGMRCIDAPLPCTPNPAPNLRLRDPGNVASGFQVDGEWQMEIWPYDSFPKYLKAWRALRNPVPGT